MSGFRAVWRWRSVYESFWFLPGLMTLVGVALSFLAGWADTFVDPGSRNWYYNGGPESARTLLSALAGSMVTVASLTFSITILTLSLASQQFGPRLLRTFITDRGNQAVLGTFLGTFMYCLFVLRRVRSDDGSLDAQVPEISIAVALLLAAASIGVLVFFIHHVSSSIRVSSVLERVGRELTSVIDHLYPEQIGRGQSVEEAQLQYDGPLYACVEAARDGYLEAIDAAAMLSFATARDVIIRIQHEPGDFVVRGVALIAISDPGMVTEQDAARVRAMFVIGTSRTPHQDPLMPVQQFVQIGLRALSPSINDPITAVNCIDQLTAGLTYAARRTFPSPHRAGDDGRLRLIAPTMTWDKFVDAAFGEIRRSARSEVAVSTRLLEDLAIIGRVAPADRLEPLRQQASAIRRAAESAIPDDMDRRAILAAFEATQRALSPPSQSAAAAFSG